MVKAPALLLLTLALAGCAAAPQAHLAADPAFRPARNAWDGTGQDPNQPRSAAASSRATRTAASPDSTGARTAHQPYSKEWWQAQDGIEAEQDARVNRSLVICRGCLSPQKQPDDPRLAKAAD